MRVTYPTSRTSPVITLGRGERALWGATSADGRAIDSTRRTVMAQVRALIGAGASRVEVYAPKEGGGFMVDQHLAGD